MNTNSKIIVATSFIYLSFLNLSANQDSRIGVVVPKAPKVLAKVPSVTLVVSKSDSNEIAEDKEEPKSKVNMIGSSKRTPPNYYKKESTEVFKDIKAGEINNSRIPAYLQTVLIPKKELVAKLEKIGFKILGEHKIDKKGKLISIIFTNDALTKMASKEKRGFASSLRILIDKKNSQINISNPLYVMKAFMQDDYSNKIASDTLNSLHAIFSDLKNSIDIVKFARLNRYHFMDNMPFYQDMITITTGDTKSLVAKAIENKKVVYQHNLNNGSIIIGVQLSRRTSKFVKKIGYQNSELLPYPILIEDGVAKILAPKYYIAVMYPKLSMSEFMKIATIPGAIRKDCDRVFR